MLNKIKEKAKATGNKAKEFVSDNKEAIIYTAVYSGLIIGVCVYRHRRNKKFETAWRLANEAYKNGKLDHDFGPYKVLKAFEPKTGEFLGEVMCHEKTVNGFLDLK